MICVAKNDILNSRYLNYKYLLFDGRNNKNVLAACKSSYFCEKETIKLLKQPLPDNIYWLQLNLEYLNNKKDILFMYKGGGFITAYDKITGICYGDVVCFRKNVDFNTAKETFDKLRYIIEFYTGFKNIELNRR